MKENHTSANLELHGGAIESQRPYKSPKKKKLTATYRDAKALRARQMIRVLAQDVCEAVLAERHDETDFAEIFGIGCRSQATFGHVQ